MYLDGDLYWKAEPFYMNGFPASNDDEFLINKAQLRPVFDRL